MLELASPRSTWVLTADATRTLPVYVDRADFGGGFLILILLEVGWMHANVDGICQFSIERCISAHFTVLTDGGGYVLKVLISIGYNLSILRSITDRKYL